MKHNKQHAQLLLDGNTIVNIENVTGGKTLTDEGLVNITTECTFTVIYKNLRFGVEARHVEDDHDIYSISIYDQTSEKNRYRRENFFDNPNDSNEIGHAYLDSAGGATYDEEISITDQNFKHIEPVENAIMSVLFGDKKQKIEPLIIPF